MFFFVLLHLLYFNPVLITALMHILSAATSVKGGLQECHINRHLT